MRTIRTKVYKFDELSKEAQEKVIDKNIYINIEYTDWWDGTYEDAANIGLKITEFDIERGDYCNGEFTLSANEVAANIFRDHGEHCETYKTATKFMEQWEPKFAEYFQTEDGEEELMKLEDEFLKSLCLDYLKLLREDYEYQTSKDAIIETIEANEYEFTKEGNRI